MKLKQYRPSTITVGRRIVLDERLLEDLSLTEGDVIIPYQVDDGTICLGHLGMFVKSKDVGTRRKQYANVVRS